MTGRVAFRAAARWVSSPAVRQCVQRDLSFVAPQRISPVLLDLLACPISKVTTEAQEVEGILSHDQHRTSCATVRSPGRTTDIHTLMSLSVGYDIAPAPSTQAPLSAEGAYLVSKDIQVDTTSTCAASYALATGGSLLDELASIFPPTR